MISADFESTLVPEDKGKQNLNNESDTNKYQKMLLVLMVTNYKFINLLMINLVIILNHT